MAATAPTTGGLHTGDPVGAPTTTHDPATHDPATHEPAATHTGDRGAKRGGMFGGRKDQEKAVAGEGRGGGFAVNAGARIGLAITQVLTAIVSTFRWTLVSFSTLVCVESGARIGLTIRLVLAAIE